MPCDVQTVSIKGRQRAFRSLQITPAVSVLVQGAFLKKGTVYDEFWMASKDLPEIPALIEILKNHPQRPDIFIATQKDWCLTSRYPYRCDLTNVALVEFKTYSEWYEKRIDRTVRQNIRKSVEKGVRTEIVPFTDDLVKGICSIYNESPVRQGRKFWHFGKDISTVKKENSSYLERSVFIGAFYESELIGFVKFVIDHDVAKIMQFLSKSKHLEKRPNNALLAKAIKVCEKKGITRLTYGEYIYGKKEQSSMIDFKRKNGFTKVDVPRYIIPLTQKGHLALRLGFCKNIKDFVPSFILSSATALRAKLNAVFRERR